MKTLIVNRFFGGAQIPTGRMAEDVARRLVEEGHEVTALASTGTYAGAERRGQDYGTTGPRDCGTAESARRAATQPIDTGRQDDSSMRAPRQLAPAGQGTLHVETVQVPKWMPRALAWVWFTWQARKRIPQMEWDVCVLMTDPPLLPLLSKRAKAADGLRDYGTAESARRVAMQPTDTGPRDATRPVAVWLMDLYPEALAASGRIAKSSPLYKWYFNKRQRALAASDLLICLGQSQKQLVETVSTQQTTNGIRPTRIAVVSPWDDRGNIDLATEDSLRNLALYAGNLGEAHCFEEILAAARYLPRDWTIRFAARGAKLDALRARARNLSHSRAEGTGGAAGDSPKANGPKASHGLTQIDTDGVRAAAPTGLRGSAHAVGPTALAVSPPNGETKTQETGDGKRGAAVEITGYASEEETPKLLASARVHLIAMSPGWEGIVVPSKLYGCIRTGRPVLFIGPENADTAREIRANNWGKVLPPGASGEDVAGAILELAARPTRAPQLQRGAGEIAALIVATAGLQDNGTTG